MTDGQTGKADTYKLYRYVALLGGIGTAFGIINLVMRAQLMSEGKIQSPTMMTLSYVGLALGLLAFFGGLIMMIARK